ncbi:hypothetical protein GCM10011409_37840 [Lentibacillus populi]|uniref:HTH cro/C1-type domain-containing protein n=1 Tax=Lentibacillus populi TaxID=1827502 RepID=A0A9W5U0P3_9BACI|nr:helix-turn-helix transcriptional regulator [Lentibacillus populi]GGB56716.1 hypothetical protein GCM10011409_37840 [Lentibacillus populi]
MEELSAAIKRLREETGIRKSELARRSGLTRAYITDIELGKKKKLSLESAGKISEGLGLTKIEFLQEIGYLDKAQL